jgi:hypothetical protein
VRANALAGGRLNMTYGHDAIGLIDTLLGKKLADMGYVIAQPGATADLTLDLEVTAPTMSLTCARSARLLRQARR